MSDADREELSGFDLQEHVVRAAVCPCSWCAVTEPLTLWMAPYGAKRHLKLSHCVWSFAWNEKWMERFVLGMGIFNWRLNC